MDKNYGFIITANDLNSNKVLALYVDSHTGGYVGWTENFVIAEGFCSKESAEKYFNCSLDMSFKMNGLNIDKESLRIQKVEFLTIEIGKYIPIDNRKYKNCN